MAGASGLALHIRRYALPGEQSKVIATLSQIGQYERVLEEASVESSQRVLLIESTLSDAALALARPGIPDPLDDNTRTLVVSYSYADLPIGKTYDCCFRLDDPVIAEIVHVEVVAVTQQWAKPFAGIPHGWKTITVFRFTPEVPSLISWLPIADGWFEYPPTIGIATTSTWQDRCRAVS